MRTTQDHVRSLRWSKEEEMFLYSKKTTKYLSSHPGENALAHLLFGVGAGFLLTYPLAASHPVRWGVAFLVAGLVVHLKAMKWLLGR